MTLVGITWHLEPLAAAGLVAGAVLYLAGVHRLALRGRKWPLKRTLPFVAGLLLIAVATQSPLAAQDTRLFSAHVMQHLLLAMGAPALLCLGAPITLLLQASPRPVQERALAVLHSGFVRFVTNPVFTWVLFVGSLFVLYYSGLYELSLRNRVFHDLVHVHFVVSGFLFFAPVVAIDPHPWRMPHGLRLLYVGLTLPAHAFLALALLTATVPLAGDWYLFALGRELSDVLGDQKLGATLMWVTGDLIAIATVGVVATQWAKQEDRAAVREDRYVDDEEHRSSQLVAEGSSGPLSGA